MPFWNFLSFVECSKKFKKIYKNKRNTWISLKILEIFKIFKNIWKCFWSLENFQNSLNPNYKKQVFYLTLGCTVCTVLLYVIEDGLTNRDWALGLTNRGLAKIDVLLWRDSNWQFSDCTSKLQITIVLVLASKTICWIFKFSRILEEKYFRILYK